MKSTSFTPSQSRSTRSYGFVARCAWIIPAAGGEAHPVAPTRLDRAGMTDLQKNQTEDGAGLGAEMRVR